MLMCVKDELCCEIIGWNEVLCLFVECEYAIVHDQCKEAVCIIGKMVHDVGMV